MLCCFTVYCLFRGDFGCEMELGAHHLLKAPEGPGFLQRLPRRLNHRSWTSSEAAHDWDDTKSEVCNTYKHDRKRRDLCFEKWSWFWEWQVNATLQKRVKANVYNICARVFGLSIDWSKRRVKLLWSRSLLTKLGSWTNVLSESTHSQASLVNRVNRVD